MIIQSQIFNEREIEFAHLKFSIEKSSNTSFDVFDVEKLLNQVFVLWIFFSSKNKLKKMLI